MRPLQILLSGLLVLLAGCDGFGSSYKGEPLAAEILDVRVEPHPVPAGTTALLTVVIRDSTASGLSYYWQLPGPNAETEEPRLQWTVPDEPGEYRPGVEVRREGGYDTVSRRFPVTVVPNE